jgi:hypothetical protein
MRPKPRHEPDELRRFSGKSAVDDVESLDVGQAQAVALGAVPHVDEANDPDLIRERVPHLERVPTHDEHPASQADEQHRPRVDLHIALEHARPGRHVLATHDGNAEDRRPNRR